MAIVPVPTARARFEAEGAALRVSLPPRRSVVRMAFLAVWLGFWWFGLTEVLSQIQSPFGQGKAFMMIWLAIWMLGGIACVAALVWMAAGVESLELTRDLLVHRRHALGFGTTRSYDLRHVRNLRAAPAWTLVPRQSVRGAMEFWGMAGGTIAFDYGPSTVRCGAVLEEAEAAQIIERLAERNPALRTA